MGNLQEADLDYLPHPGKRSNRRQSFHRHDSQFCDPPSMHRCSETLDLAQEVHTCKIPNATQAGKPDYPRSGIPFSSSGCSTALGPKGPCSFVNPIHRPQSSEIVAPRISPVGSGAKKDKKLPESGFLVLAGSGANEEKKPPERPQEAPPLSLKPAEGLLMKYMRQQLCMPRRSIAGVA